MKAPMTTTARHSRPPRLPPDLIKGHPHSGGAPHPFTSPPPLIIRAHVVAPWSQSPTASAPPPCHHPTSSEQSLGRVTSPPSCCHPCGKPPRPRATVRPRSCEPLSSATVQSTVEPWTIHPCAVHRLMDRVHHLFPLDNNSKT
jgi:hypothetical protein